MAQYYSSNLNTTAMTATASVSATQHQGIWKTTHILLYDYVLSVSMHCQCTMTMTMQSVYVDALRYLYKRVQSAKC
jgi:hypothetical protein